MNSAGWLAGWRGLFLWTANVMMSPVQVARPKPHLRARKSCRRRRRRRRRPNAISVEVKLAKGAHDGCRRRRRRCCGRRRREGAKRRLRNVR